MGSKILLIGGTGYIGKFMVEASVRAGHPTFVLVRDSTLSDPNKSPILNHFNTLGVILVFIYERIIEVQNWKQFGAWSSQGIKLEVAEEHWDSKVALGRNEEH